MRNARRFVSVLSVMIWFAVPRVASGQTVAKVVSGTNCSAADKIEVTSFVVTPATPAPGQQIKAAMKIKNKCPSGTSSLIIPWIIKKGSDEIGSGTVTLAPGITSTELVAYWTAAVGTFVFWGAADPQKTIAETDRNNNTTSDHSVTVNAKIVTQLLNHALAKTSATGADFTPKTFWDAPCNVAHGGAQFVPSNNFGNEQVWMKVDCRERPTGEKVSFWAYAGKFQLRNGWKVKSFEIVPSPNGQLQEGSGKGWSWETKPQIGGTQAAAKLNLWADAGKGIEIFLRITIEGPEGTSPYN